MKSHFKSLNLILKEKYEELPAPLTGMVFFLFRGFELYERTFISSKRKNANKIDFEIFKEKIVSFSDVTKLSEFLEDIISSFLFRKISPKINDSLLSWNRGERDLVLLNFVPTSLAVLDYQKIGKRVVSLLTEDEFLNIKDEHPHLKNNLDFFIHDLHHAEKFFNSPFGLEIQVDFYQILSIISQKDAIKKLLNESPSFKKDYHYLISDMNTHPIHQLKYLKAILYNQNKNDLYWDEIFNSFNLGNDLRKSLDHLNRSEEVTSDHINIIQNLKRELAVV